MPNPSGFLLEYPDVPFNFDMTADDFDTFWHDPKMPDVLKGDDPCSWTVERKAEIDRQRDHWVALFTAWSRRD